MKYTNKLSHSKSKTMKKNKSRRYGGNKRNNYLPSIVTQSAPTSVGGYTTIKTGGANPNPAPAPLGYSTDYTALLASMSNFGNRILLLSNLASNNLTIATAHSNTAVADAANAVLLDAAGSNLVKSFLGDGTPTGGSAVPAATGTGTVAPVYQTILKGIVTPPTS